MKKGKILLIVLLIVLIAGAAGAVYLFTDLFKTPEQLFKKYLLNNVEQVASFNTEPYGEILKKMSTEATETNIAIPIEMQAGVDMALNLNMKTDMPNNNESTTVSLNVDGKEEIDFDVIRTGDTFGVKFEEAHDKILALENRDFKKLAENLGATDDILEQIPDVLPDAKVYTEEETAKLKEIYNKYITMFFEKIGSKEMYSAEKKVTVEANNETLEANKYTLSVPEKIIATSLVETIKEMLNDAELIALLEIEDFQEQIDTLNKELDELLADVNTLEDTEVKISVYESNQKVVKTEITAEEVFEFCVKNTENQSTITMATKELENDYGPRRSMYIVLDNKIENNNGELSIEVKEEYNQDDKTIDSEDSFYSSYYASLYENSSSKIVIKSQKNDNKLTAGVELFSDDEPTDLGITMDITTGIDPQIERITSNNSIILNDYTLSDFGSLGIEILMNLQKVVTEEPTSMLGVLINMFADTDSSYDSDYNSDLDSDFDYNTDLDSDFELDTESDSDFDLDTDADSDFDTDIDTNTDVDMDSELNDDSDIVTDDIDTSSDIDVETVKEDLVQDVTDGLKNCLRKFELDSFTNPDLVLDNYLTVDKIKSYCLDYSLELIDNSTLKCTNNDTQEVFYVTMNIDEAAMEVVDVEVFTENEYQG